MKTFASHNLTQHNRLVRLVMLAIVVGLTIFLYTSYYANQTIQQLPSSQRYHMPSLISVSSMLETDDGGGGSSSSDNTFQYNNAISGSSISINSNINSINSNNRNSIVAGTFGNENVLANEVGDSSSSSLNEAASGLGALDKDKQLVSGSNNINSNIISNSLANNDVNNIAQQPNTPDDVNSSFAQQQQQQFSDVLVPSSLSSFSLPGSVAAAAILQPKNTLNNSLSNASSSNPSSNVMLVGKVAAQSKKATSSSSNNSNNNNSTVAANHLDTSKGIRTNDLYESGHSEANNDLCGNDAGEHIRLLILITSAPTHRDARLAIRQTWGHYATRRDIAMAFVLGATNIQSLEDSLEAESYMYSDIIRGRFIDSYNNLTLKTISSLEWVDTYCPRVSFVLKTDDDMFINVPRLMSFIDKHRNDKRVIFGRLAKKWKPIRNKRSKYYVSPQQYFPSVFPQFTTGPAYLMSSDAIHDLYTKALAQTYLKLEDVFTTGIVAQLVNVKRIHVNEFLNRRISFNPCNLRKAISIHMVKSNEQFDLWKKLMDTNTKCK